MNSMNEALKKTQQVRKANKDKHPTKKNKPAASATTRASAAPIIMASANPASAMLSLDFWTRGKMLIGLMAAALICMFFALHFCQETPKHPPAAQSAKKKPVVFEGVLLADNHARTALINEQVMRLGDTLNGMKIIAINADTVHLQGEKGVLEIKAGATYEL